MKTCTILLKKNVDDAPANPNVKTITNVGVFRRTVKEIGWQNGRDIWWHELMNEASAHHQPEEINAEDPLFILVTGEVQKQATNVEAIVMFVIFGAYRLEPMPIHTLSTCG